MIAGLYYGGIASSKMAEPVVMSFLRLRAACVAALLLAAAAPALAAAPGPAAKPLAEAEYKPDAIPHGQYMKTAPGGLSSSGSVLPEYFLAIYSGGTSGSYFQVATTICEVMALRFTEHRIRCVPLRSQGVASNRELMRQGRAQVMLVQSDTNWQAATGVEPIPSARSVASLHNEAGLLVVRRDARISKPEDLRGKRLSVGTEGSAARTLWVDLLESIGLGETDFEVLYSLAQEYNAEGVCGDHIDAFGLWIGHPTSVITNALTTCDVDLVGLSGSWQADLLARKPYYYPQTIPAGTYPGQDRDIETYGLKGVLVADRRADPYVVYWLTRVLVEDVELLRERNPILKSLDPEQMVNQANFLPFHDGAERYWREQGGLLPPTN